MQGTNRLYFNLFLPAGTAPAGGWPVAIYGHGFTDNKNGSPFVVAGSMARRGIATIAINVVGHGCGPLGTLIVNRSTGGARRASRGRPRVRPGRQRPIGTTEGINAAPPQTLVGSRDGLRQTVIDLMSLVREIEVGMDVDGNGTRDLDPSRISYFGQSFGGIYGTKFLAVEPNIRRASPNVPGGAIVEIARLSPVFRGLVTLSLINRTPPLDQPAGTSPSTRTCRCGICRRWSTRSRGRRRSNSCSSGRSGRRKRATQLRMPSHLRAQPLSGVPAKSMILQYARTDATVPNPTTSAIIRAGGLQDRTTLFRNDLAFAADPTFPKNPHTFLTSVPGLSHAQRRRRGARGPGSDRAVLRLQRRGRRRSRRPRAALRDADGRRTAGGSGLHPVSQGSGMRELLELLEAGPGDNLLPGLAWLAGQDVDLDPDEVKATVRRAELLLAAGGDPRRELELDGRAVMAVAEDLDEPGARDQLEDSLARLAAASAGLAAVSEALAQLRAQPDLAWQSYAGALLAEAIGSD